MTIISQKHHLIIIMIRIIIKLHLKTIIKIKFNYLYKTIVRKKMINKICPNQKLLTIITQKKINIVMKRKNHLDFKKKIQIF